MAMARAKSTRSLVGCHVEIETDLPERYTTASEWATTLFQWALLASGPRHSPVFLRQAAARLSVGVCVVKALST